MDDQHQPSTVPTDATHPPVTAPTAGARRPRRWVAVAAAASLVLAGGGIG